jgi:hypothetical protein
MALALALGFALALVPLVARTAAPTARAPADALASPALVLALLLVVGIFEGTRATGRVHWARRAVASALAIDALAAPPSDPYRAVLAAARPGATIALWLRDPERLALAGFRVFDLRSTATTASRACSRASAPTISSSKPTASRSPPITASSPRAMASSSSSSPANTADRRRRRTR